MNMEITVNTMDKTKPNNRITSLKSLYPRYIAAMTESEAPKAYISPEIAAKTTKSNKNFM
jgi:hypothetical protein